MDGETGGAFPAHPHPKVALIIIKCRDLLPEEIGDVSGEKGTASVLTSVHEDSFLLGMRMQVDKEKAILLIGYRSFRVVDLRAA